MVRFLADKSSLSRLRYPEVDSVLTPLIMAGDVATCSLIEMEILYSARSHEDFVRTRTTRSRAFPLVHMEQADFERAIQTMGELAAIRKHRSVGIPDLLIAAVAERENLTILHYDSDFDVIAGITGQPARWVVPRGSIH
jgi:predicted nucleic acid-binding protein